MRRTRHAATLLIGYDVEACAIGEGLACLGAHGMGEAIDRTSTAKALDIIRRNHEEHAVPATLFVCGRTLVHNVEALEPFVDHPLFDIQQHTYSHTLLKDDHWKGGTFLASPPVAIDQEVRQTSEALHRLLGVECIGLRTPHGYHLGLTDRPEMLEVLAELRHPFRVVVGAQRRRASTRHPLSVQPFWYGEQGYPDLLEIPFQHWLDGTWFEEYGIDRGAEFAGVLEAAIDEIVAGRPRVRRLLPRLGAAALPRSRHRLGARPDAPRRRRAAWRRCPIATSTNARARSASRRERRGPRSVPAADGRRQRCVGHPWPADAPDGSGHDREQMLVNDTRGRTAMKRTKAPVVAVTMLAVATLDCGQTTTEPEAAGGE